MGGRLITADDAEWPLLAFNVVSRRGRPAAATGTRTAGAVGGGAGAPRRCRRPCRRHRRDQGCHRIRRVRGGRSRRGSGERDVAVVSGGAFGIDGAAHRAALAADGLTVAVLAGGSRRAVSGRACRAVATRIASTVSWSASIHPGERPARHRFLTRNRLVAALAGATVVVEAGAAQRRGQHRGMGSVRSAARCARCRVR